MKTLFIVLILLALSGLINLLTKKYAFRNLTCSRELDHNRCSKNESLTLSVHLTNKKLLPLSYVEVTEKTPKDLKYLKSGAALIPIHGDSTQNPPELMMDNIETVAEYNYHKSTMMLLPYQRVTRKYNIMCDRRGRYCLSDISIKTGDLFGLETYTKEYESSLEILVYPSIKPIGNMIVDYKNPIGDVSVKRWIIEDLSIISGIREYTLSDPFNRIHWPSSAKYSSLMVKNFDFTADSSTMILLNIETSKPFWMTIYGDKIETAIETAASAADELLRDGMSSGIFTNASLSGYFTNEGNYLPPSCSPNYLSEILQLLSRITYSTQVPFEGILTKILQSGQVSTKYIVITPILTQELSRLINILSVQADVMLITFPDQDLNTIMDNISIFTMKEGGGHIEEV